VKVAAFTGGLNVPSARFRIRQLMPRLAQEDVTVDEFISPISSFPPRQRWLRPVWLVAGVASRIPQVIAAQNYDVTLLQREFFSTLSTLERFTRRPRVLDVDDAIFLNRGGRFARKLAEQSDLVICGNDFLAERFAVWASRVCVLPTAVDTERYAPAAKQRDDVSVMGWIGTSSNYRYLSLIETAIAEVLSRHPETRLRIVSDQPPRFTWLPSDQVEYVRWTPGNEVSLIQSFDVGLMPLADGDWERGKCSFKMLQYMACGLPVVVSPVGMNRQVLGLGKIGLGVTQKDDWIAGLDMLITQPHTAKAMGKVGRQVILDHFGVNVIAPKLACLLRSVV